MITKTNSTQVQQSIKSYPYFTIATLLLQVNFKRKQNLIVK